MVVMAVSYTQLPHYYCVPCRNEDADARPASYEISTTLNCPGIESLKWSAADVEKYSEAARTIGAPLVKGEELFTELQNTNSHVYLSIKT